MELTNTGNKPTPPIEITEDIQVSLNRLGRDLETHAESGIRIGKELIHLKEITPHGKFGDLVEWAYGLKRETISNYMNVARVYGNQISGRPDFSKNVLIELSRPSVPESAREEAEQHDSLTVKQAKEIADANKRIHDLRMECAILKTPRQPDINKLIPEIRKLMKGGSITEARALQISTLPADKQDVYLQEFHSKEFYRKEAERAKSERAKALQDALDAVKAKELAMAKLEEASGADESKLILKHEKELKRLREEYLEQLHEARKQANKEASELHEKLKREEIDRAYKDKAEAEKAKKQAQEKASAAYRKREELEGEIKRLHEQLEVNNPDNVDRAMEKQVRSSGTTMMFVLKELRHEMLTMGGSMERSIRAVEDVLNDVSLKLAEIKGDVGEIITIE